MCYKLTKMLIFSVRINVVGYDDDKKAATEPFYPVRISKIEDPNKLTVNVLILTNGSTSHFVYIKSLNALLKRPRTNKTHYHCVRY